ncbi:zinc finger protein 574-like [Spea bombifrons]|uniref:zinc finger protein 574-like n=1 Tax=Spea bombifrons TaxID=233779 RepID=UPI00234B4BE4|nr:zinc finger protein 574-like [Spea bombifrons]
MAEDVQSPMVFQHQYMCSECGVLYNTLEDVLVHQQNHFGGPVQAAVSQDVSLELGELQSLVQESQYQCLECGQVLLSPDELLHHQEMHMRELPPAPTSSPPSIGSSQIHYQCCECKELFSSPELWLAHRQKHIKQEEQPQQSVVLQAGSSIQAVLSLQNVLLDERTLNGWGVEMPTTVESADEATAPEPAPYACPAAMSESATEPQPLVQVREVHPYECSECSQVFPTPEEFLDHQGQHFMESEKESEASPPYGSLDNLPSPDILERLRKDWLKDEEESLKELWGAASRTLQCHECKKECANAEALQRHRKKHHPEDFPCPDCGRLFTSANRLQSHRRVHVEGTLQCPNCRKVFKKEASLEQHMRLHRGEALYLCVDCGLGFGTEITLVLHRKSHTADPLHRCQCGKTFSNMTKFLYHRRTHAGKSGAPMPKSPNLILSDREKGVVGTDQSPGGADTTSPPGLPIPGGFAEFGGKPNAPEIPTPQENGFSNHPPADAPSMEPGNPSQGFQCPLCSKEFSTRLKLVSHKQVVHIMGRKHKCGVCGKHFKKQVHIQNHMRTHTGERPFQCTTCGRTFSAHANLTRHSLLHTGEKPFRCEVCGRGFTQSSNLQQHRTLHTQPSPHTCEVCGQKFRRAAKLACHMYKHTGVMPYKCPDCEETFMCRKLMELHRLVHEGKEPFYCQECGKHFAKESQVEGHRCRAFRWAPNVCPTCGKRLNSKTDLTLHMMVHDGQRPYKCQLCTKSFTSQSALTRHRQLHSDVRPHKCDVCAKGFLESFALQIHRRVHTGERPYPCAECGKAFRQAGHLRDHKRLHTGERPYRCERCGKGFVQSVHLAEHRHVHARERIHRCKDCGRSFKNLSNLRNHLKVHRAVRARPRLTVRTELGQTITILETAEPLAETVEVYPAAADGNLQVTDMTV